MILSDAMLDKLETIRELEPSKISRNLDMQANDLGNRLISAYYATRNLETRKLITEFMTEAGVVWLRKLLMRDTAPISSSQTCFASMGDYMTLISANDEEPAVVGL